MTNDIESAIIIYRKGQQRAEPKVLKGGYTMKKAITYYVTFYQGTAYYEPAEGGYYYEGREGEYTYACKSLKRARRLIRQLAREHGYTIYTPNRCGRRGDRVGDTEMFLIETRVYSHDEGRRNYE